MVLSKLEAAQVLANQIATIDTVTGHSGNPMLVCDRLSEQRAGQRSKRLLNALGRCRDEAPETWPWYGGAFNNDHDGNGQVDGVAPCHHQGPGMSCRGSNTRFVFITSQIIALQALHYVTLSFLIPIACHVR